MVPTLVGGMQSNPQVLDRVLRCIRSEYGPTDRVMARNGWLRLVAVRKRAIDNLVLTPIGHV